MLNIARLARGTAVPLLLAACAGGEVADRPPAWRVYSVSGFDQPESVVYDPDQDVFFVSSMAGLGSDPNGMGYISAFAADDPGEVRPFAVGGMDGVVLNAPKGMAIQGETLWVADIDALRGFDRRTGRPISTLDLSGQGARMLNAITVGPDSALYVTDTSIVMSAIGVIYSDGSRIFRVDRSGAVLVFAEGEGLAHPNGISWDPVGERLVVASFAPFVSDVYTVGLDGIREPGQLARGGGRFDGMASLGDGRAVFTSWSDSSLWLLGDGEPRRIVRDLWQPADVGVDTRRGRVAVPLVLPGRVEVWQLADVAEIPGRNRAR